MEMYLTQSLHRALRACPERLATVTGARRQTYRSFAERVARLAGAFQGLGIRPGDHIAMLALNSDRYLEYFMAVFWAGGVAIPINTRWSDGEIRFALEDCRPSVLIVDDGFLPRVGELTREGVAIRHLVYAGDGACPAGLHAFEQLIADSAPIADALRSGHDLAMILYTGGTTGFPKGVMLSHANMQSAALGMAAHGCATGAVYLHAAPMFHMADLQLAFCHFLRGGTHAVIPSFNPALVAQAIERDRVSDTLLVPTMIQLFLEQPDLGNRDLSSLKTIYYGAAPISDALLDRAMRALPHTSYVQGYGMTETALTVMLPARYHTPEAQQLGKLKAAGLVTPAAEVAVVGPDGCELPAGEPGELLVRGPSVMLGYWNRPAETEQAVVDGWMHTGDFGYMDADGFIYVVDRIKDMIITGGENVYSSEVESALGTHPAVAQCAVIGIPDEKWGESVHAAIVVKTGSEVSAEELQAHCRQRIAAYKCPQSIEFRPALPVSSTGKLLKSELRKEYRAGLKSVST